MTMEERFRKKFGHIKNKGVIVDEITLDNLLNWCKEKIEEAVNKIELLLELQNYCGDLYSEEFSDGFETARKLVEKMKKEVLGDL